MNEPNIHSPSPAPNPPSGSRDHLLTEQRLRASAAIDALSVDAALRLINTQDIDVPRAVRDAIPAITRLVEATVERMRRDDSQGGKGRLIYIGAGTSGRLGVLDASECPPTFHCDPSEVIGIIAGGDAALRTSSEGKEDDPAGAHEALSRLNVGPNDIVVGIAAGGTTPYVWGALDYAKKQAKTATGMICCVPLKSLTTRTPAPLVAAKAPLSSVTSSTVEGLPTQVDFPIELLVGPEVVTGSTRMKAGTAIKLTLNMISTVVMVQLGKTWGNLMVDLKASNVKLRDRAMRILTSQTGLGHAAAASLLDEAEGRVKTALVMARLEVDAAEAQRQIDAHGGHLRPLLGPPK